MATIEERLADIEHRNEKVESDKGWETSVARKALIATFTYIAIGTYMWAIGIDKPLLNAIIPTTGFMLSTLSMPFFKRMWLKYLWNKGK